MPVRKLLVLCDTVGSEGGTESYLARLLPELRRSGVEVAIRARRIEEPGAFGIVADSIPWASDVAASDPHVARIVRREVERIAPDVVLASNVFDPAVIASAAASARLVVRVHDHRIFCPQGDRMFPNFRRPCTSPMGKGCLVDAVVHGCAGGLHKRSLDLLRARQALKDALAGAERFFVASQFMADSLFANGIDAARVTIAPPPCAPESFTTPLALMPEERRVLFAGRLVRDKGLASLVRAVALIPASRRPSLDVAGKPTSEVRDVEEHARRVGVKLRMLGKLSVRGMVAAVDAARIVAVPSLWPEPFGLVGIESQARGRPVAAYAIGGIPEWIGDAGLAVAPGDEGALAQAMDALLDERHWASRSQAALRHARAFTPAAHVARLQPLLFERAVRYIA